MRKITANHAHVFPQNVRPDGTIPLLKQVMAQTGIVQCICFAPFYEYFHGEMDANQWLADSIKDDPTLIGFGVVDFGCGKYGDQVKHMHDLGLRGIKLHPAFQRVRIDSPECCEVYEQAQKLHLPISYHTGIHWHRIADYHMLLYDEVAYRFPELYMTLEHVGGYCFFTDALAVMQNNMRKGKPIRVYAGLTSVFDRDANRPWFLSDQQVRDLLWQMGEESAIFGIDFPFNNCEEIKRTIAHIESMDIPATAKDAIFGGNLRRILNLD